MSHMYTLDLVRTAFAPSTPSRAIGGISRPLRARRIGRPVAAGRAATLAKLAFAHLIGLAFVLVLPFAGIAALAWFAAQACLQPTA